jgi:transglutaminase-like putative cysteine protease
MRLIYSSIDISPRPRLHWHFDTFGNSVATAEFFEPADTLEIRSELLLRRFSHEDFLAASGRNASAYPFTYYEEDLVDLAPFMALENPDEAPVIAAWMNQHLGTASDEVLVFLRTLSNKINDWFTYNRRERSGTQSAAGTIELGSGTCRDFAFLFMEAARLSGFAARFVTGYLNNVGDDGEEHTGGGSTHAWAEIYLPEEGWVEFDPTNRIVGSPNLIRVAVTRTPYQAIPISGIYDQNPGTTYYGMDVEVKVRTELYDPETAD